MAELVLHAKDIDADGKAYEFPLSASFMAAALASSELRTVDDAPAPRARLFAQRQGADILVVGSVQAKLVAACVRCLEDASVDVNAEVGTLYIARGANLRPAPDEDELSPEELSREFFDGDVIELDDVVREHILLEVPMQPLCREDCPGIDVPAHVRPPADFGKERDPRLAALGEIAGRLASAGDESSKSRKD